MISGKSCARAAPASAHSAAATAPSRIRATPHLIAVALLAAGCSRGWAQAVTVGPAFGANDTSVVVSVEGSVLAHQEITTPSPDDHWEHMHGPHRVLGVAATAFAGGFWGTDAGPNAFAGAAVDYLPLLYRSGAHVGFGAGAAAVAGDAGGPYVLAPRLWFAVPVTRLAGAPLAIGAMLRCQFLAEEVDEGDEDEPRGGCGPSLVLSRVDLHVSPPR